jgi:hypothetical protein
MTLEGDEEDFRSCCEDEVWKEIEDIVKKSQRKILMNFQ